MDEMEMVQYNIIECKCCYLVSFYLFPMYSFLLLDARVVSSKQQRSKNVAMVLQLLLYNFCFHLPKLENENK